MAFLLPHSANPPGGPYNGREIYQSLARKSCFSAVVSRPVSGTDWQLPPDKPRRDSSVQKP
ncbi:hypothetical protein [Thiohalophilus sp.]|uniref:hypothetical protein n=1 Tax=Thiohalophilus sp. TaxID=3028392 RepID=UPI002ACE899F|nr:hypothetical protein [Thiohalophilus sp.]MDZ7662891.1 hypothetical protein [Thiohalophilus sp.]